MSQELTEDNLFQLINEYNKVVVKYSAEWNSNCRALKPDFERIAEEHKGIKFIVVDPEKYPQARKLAQINYLPTIAAFENGEMVKQVQTAKAERLEQLVAAIA